jgi:hypothetical protein
MRTIVWDLIAFAGVGLVAGSAAWIYPPAGLIVLGAGMLGLGLWGARRASESVTPVSVATMASKTSASPSGDQ